MASLLSITITVGLLALAVTNAHAVNKCTQADGRVVYQDASCGNAAKSAEAVKIHKNTLGDAADRPEEIRAAIAARQPMIGMRLTELHRAIGLPDKVNTGDYGRRSHDQLIYYTDTRTLYVYVTNGVVTAIQNTDGGRRLVQPAPVVARPQQPQRQCPSENDIRNLEIEAGSLENRRRPAVVAELHRQIGAARACR